ncbi:MAG: hypothetical protein ABIT69_00710 [Sphingomicrobium sp.]
MRPYVFLLAAAALVPTTASAQSMNAQRFYQRAEALKKKGPLALFAMGEIRALMTEGKAAGAQSHANRLAAAKAGLKPRYCAPEGLKSIGREEFMTRLAAIPAADRSRIDMTEALTRILAAKYPCAA